MYIEVKNNEGGMKQKNIKDKTYFFCYFTVFKKKYLSLCLCLSIFICIVVNGEKHLFLGVKIL